MEKGKQWDLIHLNKGPIVCGKHFAYVVVSFLLAVVLHEYCYLHFTELKTKAQEG